MCEMKINNGRMQLLVERWASNRKIAYPISIPDAVASLYHEGQAICPSWLPSRQRYTVIYWL